MVAIPISVWKRLLESRLANHTLYKMVPMVVVYNRLQIVRKTIASQAIHTAMFQIMNPLGSCHCTRRTGSLTSTTGKVTFQHNLNHVTGSGVHLRCSLPSPHQCTMLRTLHQIAIQSNHWIRFTPCKLRNLFLLREILCTIDNYRK